MPSGVRFPTVGRMQIRRVDAHDDHDFRTFHIAMEAAQRHERPQATVWSEHEAAVMFGQADGYMEFTAYGAFDDGRLVGAAHTMVPLLDNTDKVYAAVNVPPDQRRRGVGSALVDHLVRVARSAGRPVLIVDSHFPVDAGSDHPHRRFAARHGFHLANTEMHRVLELPVADEQLAAWADEAAAEHDAYSFTTYEGDLPEQLLPSYVHLLNQLVVDAPTGDIDFEAEGLTVEAFRARRARLREQGRTTFTTVATVGDGAAREAVAHSVVGVPAEGVDEPHAYQWATLVRRDHRGHHLGLAVKARNLRAVQKARPERRLVHTSNSEANGPMVAINERIGFRPVEVNAEYLRRLG